MADVAQSLNQLARGAATSFDSSTYKTAGMMYPDDLLADKNNQYGGNYVIFYINVHEDSTLIKSGKEATVAGNIPTSMRGDIAGMNVSKGSVTTLAAITGAATANATDVAGKTAGAAGVDLTGKGKVIANTVLGGVTGAAVVAAVGGASKKYKRMQKAIALYVPTDLSIKYGVNWEEADLAGSSAIVAATEGMGEALKKGATALGQGAQGRFGEAKQSAIGAGKSAGGVASAALNYGAGLALQVPGAGQFLSKSSSVAANPKKEQLFKNVDFRTFSFSYQFFPRDAAEAENVMQIIKAFKLHMHPEYKDSQHFLYIYPSEFDIFYYQNGKENMNLHRHTSCVLTDMNISYAPQGIFATFENGMPTQINVQLQFKELALLSKESVQDGY